MALAILFFLIVFLTVIVRSLVFTSMRRSLARETVTPEPQHNNILERGLHILGRTGLAVVARSHLENNSDRGNSSAGEPRTETYLSRIVALTGATQEGTSFVLSVGKVRFSVRNGCVRQAMDGVDPKWARWETCFHPAHQDMAKEEQIATVLLQLRNNPGLFDSWANKRELPFKADGQMFNRPK
jgi:hypothetical protein